MVGPLMVNCTGLGAPSVHSDWLWLADFVVAAVWDQRAFERIVPHWGQLPRTPLCAVERGQTPQPA